jgi:hypothetical protein
MKDGHHQVWNTTLLPHASQPWQFIVLMGYNFLVKLQSANGCYVFTLAGWRMKCVNVYFMHDASSQPRFGQFILSVRIRNVITITLTVLLLSLLHLNGIHGQTVFTSYALTVSCEIN